MCDLEEKSSIKMVGYIKKLIEAAFKTELFPDKKAAELITLTLHEVFLMNGAVKSFMV